MDITVQMNGAARPWERKRVTGIPTKTDPFLFRQGNSSTSLQRGNFTCASVF